jgi:hypothetical protein
VIFTLICLEQQKQLTIKQRKNVSSLATQEAGVGKMLSKLMVWFETEMEMKFGISLENGMNFSA